jgi:hypothetical protein
MAVRKGFENLDRRFLGQCGSASKKTKGFVGFGGFFAHGASLAGQHPGFQKQSTAYNAELNFCFKRPRETSIIRLQT